MKFTVKNLLQVLALGALAWSTPQPSIAQDAKAKNAQMLIQTLSEEKTEIQNLAAQQAQFKKLGSSENRKLATLWGRWIRDHKAAGPAIERLIRQNGGDPMNATILKPAFIGAQEAMLNATHKDHEAAITTSQMRHALTNSTAIKTAMSKRASIARQHLKQMAPYHKMHHNMTMNGQKISMTCPHCNVKMVNGKCPVCKMTAAQMKKM